MSRFSVLRLPNSEERDDIVDWIERGGTLEEFRELEPEEIPIDEIAKPVPGYVKLDSIEPSMMPKVVFKWAQDCADRLNVCPSYIFVPLIVSFSALVGRSVVVSPRRHACYYEVPNLWGMIIGRPSTKKTPSSLQGLVFIKDIAERERVKHEEERFTRQVALEKNKSDADCARKVIRNPKSSSADLNQAAMMLEKALEEEEKLNAPMKRYLVSDVTHAKLTKILQENPKGVMVLHDELKGLLARLSDKGGYDERTTYLESWSGKGSREIDRVTAESYYVKGLCLSVFGTMHPHVMEGLVKDASRGDRNNDDGLLNRFQLMVWPDSVPFKSLDELDRPVNEKLKGRLQKVAETLASLKPADFGCERDRDGENMVKVRFSDQAYQWFRDWHDRFLREVKESEELGPLLESHFAKYESLVPSLALLFYLINWADKQVPHRGEIPAKYVQQAVRFTQFLSSHAEKVFQIEKDEKVDPLVVKLMDSIDRGKIESGDSFRKIQQKCSFLVSSKITKETLDKLQELGVLKTMTRKAKNGKMVRTMTICNPRKRNEC